MKVIFRVMVSTVRQNHDPEHEKLGLSGLNKVNPPSDLRETICAFSICGIWSLPLTSDAHILVKKTALVLR